MPAQRVKVRLAGKWGSDDVITHQVPSTRRIMPEVEEAIERAWTRAFARLGEKLFDGKMCRLEKWEADERLRLWLSPTSYKPFLGTNLENAALADRFGNEVLANGVGLSAALETADGWLLFGKRNESVAYYPGRVHPFAGSLENGNSFDEMLRELDEELHLRGSDVAQIACIGIVEDLKLRQPEVVFSVKTIRTRQEIEHRLDPREHDALVAVKSDQRGVTELLDDPELTPVAEGTLRLWLKTRP